MILFCKSSEYPSFFSLGLRVRSAVRGGVVYFFKDDEWNEWRGSGYVTYGAQTEMLTFQSYFLSCSNVFNSRFLSSFLISL